jgi:hypothetical protein
MLLLLSVTGPLTDAIDAAAVDFAVLALAAGGWGGTKAGSGMVTGLNNLHLSAVC